MRKRFSIVLLMLLMASSLQAATSKLELAKKHYLAENYQAAHAMLNEIPLEELDPKRMALIEFFRGLIFFGQKNYNFALRHFNKSIKVGSRLEDVTQYYIGLSYVKLSNNDEALKAFKKVLNEKPSDFLEWQADLEIARIQFDGRDYNSAAKLFKKLERKMRYTEPYPDILWSLLKINHIKGRRLDSCYWARKLYKKYPLYDPVAHWGLRWKQNLVDGKPLLCKDTLEDQQDRIKRLQHLGASQKAFAELNEFKKSKEDDFIKDMTMAEYLVNEGMVAEAFKKLLPYYKNKEHQKDFDYITLLAKAASRSGEFQTAVGIYQKAYRELKGGDSRSALYRSAFLSYQHQDYDGALRSYEELVKRFPLTSLARQANWYIPWLYYLKGHYQKSYDLFSSALKNRHRKLPRRISSAKLKYWMAMSKLKQGNQKAAEDIFLEITQDEYMGYYSIAAVQRLKTTMGQRGLASVKNSQALALHENWIPHLTKDEVTEDEIEMDQSTVAKTNESFYNDWEKLPYMREYLDLGKPTQIYATVTEPEFRRHIERAKDMSLLGMGELAKWELYSIEGRTKNKDYLKTLMFEYHRNGIYHRSSYIGTSHFGGDRTHLGLHLGAALWQYVYPRAFEEDVLKQSQRFNVPAEFVWSIMKAETNFRPDAMSPVGARGLMQVMTHTGRKVASMIGKDITGPDLLKPGVSIEIGTRYLLRNLKRFDGKVPLAAAAYNGGPHRVHQWLHQFGHLDMDEFVEHIPFLETRNYVKKVTRYFTLYNLLYNKNTDASSWLAEHVDVYPEGTPPTRETWEVL